MEIYLCHFGVLRVANKLKLTSLFGTGVWSYLFTTVFVLGGAIAFSVCVKKIFKKIK